MPWVEFNNNKQEWNLILCKFDILSYYNIDNFGKFYSYKNWESIKLIYFDQNNKSDELCLVLYLR